MIGFYNSFSFLLGFMILVLVFNMMLGAKFTEWFLLLVLLSMVIINSDKISGVFAGISKEV